MNDRDLWRSIYRLYELLLREENKEESYQEYFETHPVVFRTLGFDAHHSYEKRSDKALPFDKDRGFRPEPDFLCASLESAKVTVFELKTPFVEPVIVQRKDGARKKLNAKVETYVSQATEYADSIREREEARRIVTRDLGMDSISSYDIVLVYGLREDNDPSEVARIVANRKIPTGILYYDTLLDHLTSNYRAARPNTENRKGLCIVYHLILHPEQLSQKAYIADHGDEQSDRQPAASSLSPSRFQPKSRSRTAFEQRTYG